MPKTTLVLQPLPENDVPPVPPTRTNEVLMAGVKQGNRGAFWTLYWRHADLLREVIGRFVSNEEERDEILHQVFQEIAERPEHYSPEKGRVLGWMITLARRRAVEHTTERAIPARRGADRVASIPAAPRSLVWKKRVIRVVPGLDQAA